MKLTISKRARRQIDKIQAWWVENRPAAAALFLDELDQAKDLLRVTPEIGAVYTTHKTGVVRWLLLSRTSHRLYYRYRRDRNELTVLAVWGAPRERGPKL